MFKNLMTCKNCDGIGTIDGIGYMKSQCASCKGTGAAKSKRIFAYCINKVKTGIAIFSRWLAPRAVHFTIVLFLAILLVYCLYPYKAFLSFLVASLGSIFLSLKYKLDRMNYHKSLFEERYAIFTKFDEILSDVAHLHSENKKGERVDWRTLSEKLDSIYRKSYFLFGEETKKFMDEFREKIVCISHTPKNEEQTEQIKEFIKPLYDKQSLSEKFPELRIDGY